MERQIPVASVHNNPASYLIPFFMLGTRKVDVIQYTMHVGSRTGKLEAVVPCGDVFVVSALHVDDSQHRRREGHMVHEGKRVQ